MAIINALLWLGLVVGHTALLIGGVNRWYGRPLPHQLLGVIRTIHALLVPVVLLGLWLTNGWNISRVFESASSSAMQTLQAAYILVCCAVAYLILTVITVGRLTHRAAALLNNHTRTINMATRLGYRPVGHGKYRYMARLFGNQVFQVDFTEKTLRLPNLPSALDGLSILHLSDLHLSGTPDRDFYFEVMNICRAWEPELVMLTGDIVDSDKHHRWIMPVLHRLQWRCAAFGILGNHDTWHDPNLVRRRLRRVGIEVLENRWKQIEVRGHPLVVIGNESPWLRPAPDLRDCPTNAFRLCLSHTPDNFPWACRHGVDLMLAGHNHGGQIRLPLIGSILVPSRFGRRYDCGTFQEGSTVLHVVRGLAAQHPLRYNCRPEVALLVLRSTGA
jgi:predicted MPP superfamily phosphohydrolase